MMKCETHANQPGDATRLLASIASGDRSAVEKLMPIVYEELRSLAGAFMRKERSNHTLQPTALVHEAFLRLVGTSRPQYRDRKHFLAVAATAMRRVLVNHAIAQKTAKRSSGTPTIQFSESDSPSSTREVDTLALDEALTDLSSLDQRKAKIVELRFFGGMTVKEVADVVDVSVSTVEADWRMARAWLSKTLAME